jgi:transcriptional regulatory protein GAL4
METIQDITAFCQERPDTLHPGLTWYTTYFLFQAVLVLNIHYLQKPSSEDVSLLAVDADLYQLSVSRAHNCLASLSKTSKPATRCLEVLERIKDNCQSRGPLPLSSSVTENMPHLNPPTSTSFPAAAPFAADPALQIFFENTSLEADPFEGIEGFPGTQEIELFDYLPPSTYATSDTQGCSMPFDPVRGPT